MLVKQRREVLFQQLDIAVLEGWSHGNQEAAHTLLAEYHDIFSLDPGELGCTNLAKHEIRDVDDEPFKEQFQRIPLPWWMRSGHMWKTCWKQVLFAPVKAHGVTQL